MRRLPCLLPVCLLLGCSSASESPVAVAPETVTVAPDPIRKRPRNASDLEQLAREDAIAFLEACLERFDREVQGYRALLIKQERIKGKLGSVEHVAVQCRENPFSVRMEWKQGQGLAARTVFVKGQNNDQMLVKPAGWRGLVGIIQRDPWGEDARTSSRYPITEFGIRIGMHKTLTAWQAARQRGDLQVLFGGVRLLPELAERPCWEMKRVGYKVPEKDGITEETFYFDTENWLQLGTYITGEEKKLIGTYYFRDVVLNPRFDEDTFTRQGMKK